MAPHHRVIRSSIVRRRGCRMWEVPHAPSTQPPDYVSMTAPHTPRLIALVGGESSSAAMSDLLDPLRSLAQGRPDLDLHVRQVVTGTVDVAGFADVCGVILVVPATGDVSDDLVELWDSWDDIGLPRLIALTGIDSPVADVEATIEQCQEAFGDLVPVLAVDLPVLGDDDRPIGLIDLITGEIIDYSPGYPIRSASEQRHLELVQDDRNWLTEAIIVETDDERLVEAFVTGSRVDDEAMSREFYATVARGRLHPICVTASTPYGLGIDVIVDIIVQGFPTSPIAAP